MSFVTLFWKVRPGTASLTPLSLTAVPSRWCQRKPWVQFARCARRVQRAPEEAAEPEQQLLCSLGPEERKGATGSAVRTQMNTQQSAEEKSLDKVSALIPGWRQPAGRSPWPRISWTGTRSAGRATPASCGPNTPTCQLRFGWKWRWQSPISSACPWPRSSWWFTMCFSGRRTRRSTAPAPRRRTAPSARRGSDDCTARTHLHTACRWLHAPDVRLQRGRRGEAGRGMTASWVWDAGWGPEGGQRGASAAGSVPHAECRWGGGDCSCQLYPNTQSRAVFMWL